MDFADTRANSCVAFDRLEKSTAETLIHSAKDDSWHKGYNRGPRRQRYCSVSCGLGRRPRRAFRIRKDMMQLSEDVKHLTIAEQRRILTELSSLQNETANEKMESNERENRMWQVES